MISILNFLISKLKKTEYKLDSSIKTIDILGIVWIRVLYLWRGIYRRIGTDKCGKFLFVGKKVELKGKRFIKLGNGITIDNHVSLDALSIEGIHIGNNVHIGTYTKMACSGSLKNLGKGLKIGNNSGIGDFCFFGAAGGIQIGNNVIMGQNVRFHSENHNFDRLDIPIKEQGVTNKGITVGNDCWIGSGAVFLDGVEVGDGCVIGANTLVNKNIPAYSVAVGNPVKIVKSRLEMKERIN
ncbi:MULTISPECIES: acyltransferase [Bacillus]|uniref:acyltransferase n=1 Tax=Bacillus TaxID=1386 RepID=UPI0005CA9A73|nr:MULTISPECIES: acyltransferase [Bacillus]KIZ30506.1 transferase [Bacillus cereus]MEC3333273.1 DapH/DapD/GlmU-related protein [Bacillus cereus]QIZ45018.1 acyltransferase [Bacillus sp. RZ2MS9]